MNIKRFGILHLNDDYGESLSELTAIEFQKSGGVVKREAFDPDRMDLSEQIARLLDSEAILILAHTSQIPLVLEQIRKKSFNGVVVSNNSVADPAVIALPQTQGVFSALPIIFNPNFIAARELKQKFQEKYGKQTSHSVAAGYDLIKLISELLEDQEISRTNLKARLEKGFIHSGALGDVRLEPGKRDLSFPLFPARIQNGKVQYQ
jgi:ABC-type branched-subunit amino acid transport system substrate-binding protein